MVLQTNATKHAIFPSFLNIVSIKNLSFAMSLDILY